MPRKSETPAPPDPNAPAANIGAFVRQRRRAEGLTQKHLAELAGVGPRVVWDLERGKATLRLDGVDKILQVLGYTIGPVPMTKGRPSR